MNCELPPKPSGSKDRRSLGFNGTTCPGWEISRALKEGAAGLDENQRTERKTFITCAIRIPYNACCVKRDDFLVAELHRSALGHNARSCAVSSVQHTWACCLLLNPISALFHDPLLSVATFNHCYILFFFRNHGWCPPKKRPKKRQSRKSKFKKLTKSGERLAGEGFAKGPTETGKVE